MFVLFGMGQVLLDAHRLLDCGPREQVVNLFHTLLCVRAVVRTHLCVYGGRGGGECGGGGGTYGGGPPVTPALIEKTTTVPDLQSARFFLSVAQRELDRCWLGCDQFAQSMAWVSAVPRVGRAVPLASAWLGRDAPPSLLVGSRRPSSRRSLASHRAAAFTSRDIGLETHEWRGKECGPRRPRILAYADVRGPREGL